MIAHASALFPEVDVEIRDNRAVAIKTFFSLAFDASSAADHWSTLSGSNRLTCVSAASLPS
jgi:hypothetical protein